MVSTDGIRARRMRGSAIIIFLLLTSCAESEIERVKDAVANKTRDPTAAEFRNVRYCDGRDDLIAGEMNAKNAFGAYVGFTPFFWDRGVITIVEESIFDNPERQRFVAKLMDRCREGS